MSTTDVDGTPTLYRAREFARKAGVTVRTLHHYDRLGLLKPAATTASGHRLYGKNELLRLEKIVALKFIGLPLRSIWLLLEGDLSDLATTLQKQRSIVVKMREHLDEVLHAIDRAQTRTAASEEAQWDMLRTIIEVMEMSNKMEWAKKYYTPEQLADLESRATPEVLAKGESDWKELIAEVEASLQEDPASELAQSLAQRWDALIDQFTGGNQGIRDGPRSFYADEANWPSDFKRPFSSEACEFIAKARDIRKRNQ